MYSRRCCQPQAGDVPPWHGGHDHVASAGGRHCGGGVGEDDQVWLVIAVEQIPPRVVQLIVFLMAFALCSPGGSDGLDCSFVIRVVWLRQRIASMIYKSLAFSL